jgi:formate hydrogenlyase transcriptional activator
MRVKMGYYSYASAQKWGTFAEGGRSKLVQPGPGYLEAEPSLRRYQALLWMADSIARHRSLEELFREITSRLREVTSFEFITFNLHDAASNQMCVYYSEGLELEARVVKVDVDSSPSGWVWQQQSALAISDVASETRFEQVLRVLRAGGIHSYCCVPLTSARRRLGALGVGSRAADRYSERDLDFLRRVGDLVAVATESALTYNALEEEKERLQMLLEVNATLVSHFDLQESFPAISGYIRKVVAHDLATISLYDEAKQCMRKYAVDYPGHPDLCRVGETYGMKDSSSGQAFLERETVICNRADLEKSPSPYVRRLAEDGMQKICCIPLITRKGPLGSFNLASKNEAAFSPRDVGLLKQIAAQLAIALDNSRAYNEIAKLKDKLAQEKIYLQGEIRSVLHFDEIVGESMALKRVLDQAKTVAPSDATVLIQGETGTGKELIARAVHRMSSRKDGSFIKMNCAAIPTGLLESELFGHEKGAFTGAISQKVGRLELADKGTLFLDEVGDIPMELQPKLLRVLQDQEFERLGSTRTIKVNIRLVAATNRDLAADIIDKVFRSDLYYRLNVFPIHMPALRDRREDIPLLVRFFVQNFASRMNKVIGTIPTETMNALKNWHWPGNVRELANFMERSVILTEGSVLHVPLAELISHERAHEDTGTLENVEREHILRALREARGVVAGIAGAASRLGLKRTTLQSKMQKMGISRRDYSN